MSEIFDLAILGGGPGGYVCAIRAAQLGLKTAVIEKRSTLGGTCVNVGCIPSKALLDSSEHYERATKHFKDHGIIVKGVELDIKAMMGRKEKVVKELTDGLNYLMNKNKITVFQGAGRFKSGSAGKIEIAVEDSKKSIVTAKKAVIATGSEIIQIPNVPIDGKRIITSDHAIALDQVPGHLVVLGGGVIGLELGSVWRRLGSQVTVVELLPGILPGLDGQIREATRRVLEKQGVQFMFESKVVEAKASGKGVSITVETKEGKKNIDADVLLVAVGRRPYADNSGAKEIGVNFNSRGRIDVNPKTLETSVPGIFAIGDVIEGPMLAHKAEEEGVFVAENLAGKHGHINYNTIPGVVYTWPEVAWVGKSEEDLQKLGVAYRTGKFLFRPNGRAKAMNEPDGQVKIIADQKTDTILGVHILGPGASELIAEAVLAMEFGASSEDLARTCHAHPTLSEVMKEAAMDVEKRSIHS